MRKRPEILVLLLQLSTEGNHSISGDESMQVYDTYYHTNRLKDFEDVTRHRHYGY
jgi:hypothetical protein